MKTIVAALAALAVVGTGCVGVVHVPGHSAAGVKEKKCPPGHEWSDGECHSRGKGHDPAKKGK